MSSAPGPEGSIRVDSNIKTGEILIRPIEGGDWKAIEVLALDRGPGIPHLDTAITDGYSTAGSAGAGLGTVRRQADEFDSYSRPSGTIILARIWNFIRGTRPDALPRDAVVNVPKPGETVCGDGWEIRSEGDRRVFLVTDGLGHGPRAAEAASVATAVFNDRFRLSPVSLPEELHNALRATRGAAAAVAAFDRDRRILRFAGVGNIVAAVVSASLHRQNLVSHNGTAGMAMRRVQEFAVPIEDHAVLVMHSDGVAAQWSPATYDGLWGRDPALAAAAIYRDFSRRRDDSTVLAAHL